MRLLFRYRNPSLKTMLGITKAKKRFNNAVGITAESDLSVRGEISSAGCFAVLATIASQ